VRPLGLDAKITDEETQANLAGIRYRHTSSGRVETESKDDARKRGRSSSGRGRNGGNGVRTHRPRQSPVVMGGSYSIRPK